MPVVVCTSCKARINVKDQMIGKKAKCPKCQTLILLKAADAAPSEGDADSASGPPKKSPPPRRPAPKQEADPFAFDEEPAPSPKKKSKKPQDDEPEEEPADDDGGGAFSNFGDGGDDPPDEDDGPKRGAFEPVDDDPPPRRKGRADDDDRPARRKGRSDDDDEDADDDERPARRKGRDDDDDDADDDDRPARRKGRDDDSEDDDRPRRKGRNADEDEDDDRSSRKGSAPKSGFKRVISGIPFLFVLLFFFLPWVSVTCDVPAMGPKKAEKIVVTQSGFQAMYGGVSSPNEDTSSKKPAKGDFPDIKFDVKDKMPKEAESQDLLSRFSPFTVLFLIATLAGLGIGCALPFTKLKTMCMAGVAAVLLLMLGLTMVVGLPLGRQAHDLIDKQRDSIKQAQKMQQDALKEFGGKAPPGMPALPKIDNSLPVVSYTPWFWIEWFFVATSPAAHFVGMMMAARAASGGKSRAPEPRGRSKSRPKLRE